ncbi:MAG TPA: prepilin-type N-terminal cleavage/methylation domain-containing protein [Thermoanaerobaculia bacterium]|nr:prepilin-type N-terminal cleavage/methylation domain-containing protein [Thermoanaerobaculia bacterium]
MKLKRQLAGTRQRGYSLAEALVVVAIIGVVTLVMVPNFMSMYRNSRFKNAARSFATMVRDTRQKAVTTSRPTMVSIGTTAAEKYTFWVYQKDDAGVWQLLEQVDLQPGVTNKSVLFSSTDFTDTEQDDDRSDMIFLRNGAIDLNHADYVDLEADPAVVLSTTDNIPDPEFEFSITRAGAVRAQ